MRSFPFGLFIYFLLLYSFRSFKLYRVIVMFVVQSENITCHWEFSAHRAGLRLVNSYFGRQHITFWCLIHATMNGCKLLRWVRCASPYFPFQCHPFLCKQRMEPFAMEACMHHDDLCTHLVSIWLKEKGGINREWMNSV